MQVSKNKFPNNKNNPISEKTTIIGLPSYPRISKSDEWGLVLKNCKNFSFKDLVKMSLVSSDSNQAFNNLHVVKQLKTIYKLSEKEKIFVSLGSSSHGIPKQLYFNAKLTLNACTNKLPNRQFSIREAIDKCYKRLLISFALCFLFLCLLLFNQNHQKLTMMHLMLDLVGIFFLSSVCGIYTARNFFVSNIEEAREALYVKRLAQTKTEFFQKGGQMDFEKSQKELLHIKFGTA